MAYGIIRIYEYEAKNGDIIADVARNVFGPIVAAEEGFHEFHWIDSGDGEGASMAIFDTKEAAEASTFLAGGVVHERLAEYLPKPPRIIEGKI
jgi:hypothetical protein